METIIGMTVVTIASVLIAIWVKRAQRRQDAQEQSNPEAPDRT